MKIYWCLFVVMLRRRESRPLAERAQRLAVHQTLPHPGRFRLAAFAGHLAKPLRGLLPDEIKRAFEFPAPPLAKKTTPCQSSFQQSAPAGPGLPSWADVSSRYYHLNWDGQLYVSWRSTA